VAGRRAGIACALAAAAALLALPGTASAPAASAPARTANGGCPGTILYFSRGSGQPRTEPADEAPLLAGRVFARLEQRLSPHALGSMTNAYTAVPVPLKPPRPGRYRASVENGLQAALQNVVDLIALCPTSRLVLGGYSQGAQVTHAALARYPRSVAAHVAAVVLFGDPLFDEADHGVLPVVAAGERLAPGREGVVLKLHLARAVFVPPAYRGKVLSWCHVRDPVCQAQLPLPAKIRAHDYRGDVAQAVEQIAKRLPAVDFHRFRVAGTCDHGGCALEVWRSPSTRGGSALGSLPEGREVDVHCQLRGQALSSANGAASDVWDALEDGGGYVPDLYLDTPGVGAYSPGIPRCPHGS